MKYSRGRRRLPDGGKGATRLVRYDGGANEKRGAAEDPTPPKETHTTMTKLHLSF
jgi:hypothetical protein